MGQDRPDIIQGGPSTNHHEYTNVPPIRLFVVIRGRFDGGRSRPAITRLAKAPLRVGLL